MNSLFTNIPPRREHFCLCSTKNNYTSVVEIWNIEESDIPSSNNIRRRFIPKPIKLLKKFSLGIHAINNFIWFIAGILTQCKNIISFIYSNSYCNNSFIWILIIRKAFLAFSFNINISNYEIINIIFNLAGKLLCNIGIRIISIAVNF